MRAACQQALLDAGLREQAPHRGDMHRLAAMRTASHRELGLVQTVRIRSTALDQRNGLQELNRRARIDGRIDVSERELDLAIFIRDGDRAAMAAFDKATANHLDKNRIGESRIAVARCHRR